MQNKLSMRYIISGKVQGVSFRAYTQEQAEHLGLTGYARNLEDGRVEVIACGKKEKLNILQEWLKHGPKLAKVDSVTNEEIPWQEHQRFAVKRD
ncbi:MAG: acylphosphatase [Gammaproteobacteria bacterium]|nr:acylphosphatase [Gammaproteobacteria bacterium]